MNDIYILAIETSCDETSASIIKNGNIEIGTVVLSQMDTHKKYGGVVPEIASRMHIENITLVFEELFEKTNLNMDNIDYIGVTNGPGLIGSLLIGIQAAKTISFIYNKPLIPINHLHGHIYANRLIGDFKFPLIALIISGGHTDIIYMEKDFSFKKIGSTKDDAVGETYDKVARIMDISYPGGPLVDKLSYEGKPIYKLPIPLDDNSYDFSFSGLKTAVRNLYNTSPNINKEDLCSSFQDVVVKIITKKTMRAVKEYNVKQLLISGGVAANSGLRTKFKELCEENNIELLIPPIKYCTDNAAMIGCAAYYAIKNDLLSENELSAFSTTDVK
ncbi:MAG: tRNA (adenosine(37)-N6)-threonylcarbamoyltransferase complex transferase subunit TsaD [Bacilli bacterium]|nr:tRNA (adenosine(37)-N6)-threonylcarbamoyltransferase complex transferase subunit TsaD [Bacilli bacterium]